MRQVLTLFLVMKFCYEIFNIQLITIVVIMFKKQHKFNKVYQLETVSYSIMDSHKYYDFECYCVKKNLTIASYAIFLSHAVFFKSFRNAIFLNCKTLYE